MANAQVVNTSIRSDAASYQLFQKFHTLGSGEIRLLEILPASGKRGLASLRQPDRLECNIIHSSLGANHVYEALSYCWGTSRPTEYITIVNYGEHQFQVTKSLLEALRQFRRPHESRLLWVDFLCINQKNDVEKAQQVSQMTNIYTHATQVLGWLGPADRSDESVFEFNKHRQEKKHDIKDVNGAWFTDLSTFLSKPFFSRIWIIQEVAVARKLQLCFGKFQMPWENFRDLLESILEQYGDTMNTSNADAGLERIMMLLSTRNLVTEHITQTKTVPAVFFAYQTTRMDQNRDDAVVGRGDWGRFVDYSRTFGSTDPRDRLFALSGLVPEEWRYLKPDYDSSNTADRVFYNFTMLTITQMQSLNILAQAGIHKSNLPSWIPDYTRRLAHHPLSIEDYNSSGESYVYQDSSSSSALRVSGLKIGTITETKAGFQNTDDLVDEHDLSADWRPGTPPALERVEILERTVASVWNVFGTQHAAQNIGKLSSNISDYRNFGSSLATAGSSLKDLITTRTVRVSQELEKTWQDLALSHYDPSPLTLAAYRKTLIGSSSQLPLPSSLTEKYLPDLEALWRDNIKSNPWHVNSLPGNGDQIPTEIKVVYNEAHGARIKDAGLLDRSRKQSKTEPWITDYYLDAKRAVKRWQQKRADGGGENAASAGMSEMDKKIAEYESQRTAVKRKDDDVLRPTLARMFNRQVERMSKGRKFAVTDRPLGLAWVPQLARPGDEIWILVGGSVPFALRPVAERPGTFRLIGEAYHYGVMHGEYFTGEYQAMCAESTGQPVNLTRKQDIELI